MGIVQEIVETGKQVERAIELAEQIAAQAPLAVYATKASARTYIERGEAACIADFATTQSRLAQTEDAAEGVASFKERRDPRFQGR